MNILRYSEWRETALTLHMISQMLGKTKLSRMEPQPQWNHIVLSLTPSGFTTGIIPYAEKTFSIELQAREGRVVTDGIDGRSSSFVLTNGVSISEYYAEYNRMLADVMCQTEIYTVPQEMNITTPFEKNTDKLHYDGARASDFFHMCVFAHNAILKFLSSFRGKKMLPSFFWGTFDVTGIVFSGKGRPFPGKGVIEETAFDEQMIEFGFWPGDDIVEEPSFFVLPYPFLTEEYPAKDYKVRPEKAIYSPEKAEYFLSLRDALSYADPVQTLQEFFRDSYKAVTGYQKWENMDWFDMPLLIEKGSHALKRHRHDK